MAEDKTLASNGSEWVQDTNDDAFETDVLERSFRVPVVVDFWAPWCGPCRILGPTLEKLAREGQGKFVLAKVDVDRSPRLAQAFGVRGIPAVMGFRDGKLAGEFTGALPESSVRQFIESLAPSAAQVSFERAEEVRSQDVKASEALYQEALSLDANHPGARVGLAEILAARGETVEANSLIEKLGDGGALSDRVEHLAAALRIQERKPRASEKELRKKLEGASEPGPVLFELGKLLASESRYSEALEALLEAARTSPELARGEAKELMVEIFHIIGVRSELADEYRTKLSRLIH